LSLSGTGNAQLAVSFDFSNVDQTIAFLKKTTVTETDVDAMVSTPGVQIIIRKIRSTDSIAKSALRKVIKGIVPSAKEADFQYGVIKEHLAELENFTRIIQLKKQIILDSIQALSAYLPAGKIVSLTVSFLAGGFSAGFTMKNDNVFYIGMHQYKNDFNGIVNTCQHELFHNIQSLSYDRTAILKKLEKANEQPALYAYYLGQHIFVEGSAEYIADIDLADRSTPFILSQYTHANVNKGRMSANFYLIEKIIMDAYQNPDKTDADVAYNIMFDWAWNNPGYAVGKLMAKSLVTTYGPAILKKYLSQDPMLFIKDYILLTRKDKQAYPYTFSEDFEKMIDAVLTKVENL
jgi:hypothetical protein